MDVRSKVERGSPKSGRSFPVFQAFLSGPRPMNQRLGAHLHLPCHAGNVDLCISEKCQLGRAWVIARRTSHDSPSLSLAQVEG